MIRPSACSSPVVSHQPVELADNRRGATRTAALRSRLIAGVCAAAILLPAGLPPAWAQNQLPALGDPASEDFSLSTERKLGDEIMREIRADPDYVDDPVLLEYLQSVWQPLVAQARLRGNITADIDERMAWEPFLVPQVFFIWSEDRLFADSVQFP